MHANRNSAALASSGIGVGVCGWMEGKAAADGSAEEPNHHCVTTGDQNAGPRDDATTAQHLEEVISGSRQPRPMISLPAHNHSVHDDDGGTALADDEATPCVGGVALPLLESRTRRHARLKVLVCILEEVLQQESTITYGELTAMVSETGPAVRCTSRTPWGEFSDDLFLEGAVPPAKRDVVVTPAKLRSALDHFRHEIRRHDLYMAKRRRKGRSMSPRGSRVSSGDSDGVSPRSRSPSPTTAARSRSKSTPAEPKEEIGTERTEGKSGKASAKDFRAMLGDLKSMLSSLERADIGTDEAVVEAKQPDEDLRERARRRVKVWEHALRNSTLNAPPTEPGHLEAAKRPHPASSWVYVLWDIENVSIPRALNPKTGMPESGFKVANAIRDFLAKKGVLEKGASRERFKLYFRPKAQSTPDQVLRDLERGGFVCVAAMTSKPEAADRLISEEIKRLCTGVTETHVEMVRLHQLLNQIVHEVSGWVEDTLPSPNLKPGSGSVAHAANRSTIVLISSDFDFKNDLKAAHEKGFRIILIHDSSLEGDRKEQYMRECHAKLYPWSDVMEKVLRMAHEDRDARKRLNDAANKLALLELTPAELSPVLAILHDHVAEAERTGTDSSIIDREYLIHALNIRFATRTPEDTAAIAVVEGHGGACDTVRAGGVVAGVVRKPVDDDGNALFVSHASVQPLKYYIKRVEMSKVITRGSGEQRALYIINADAVSISTDIPLDAMDEWEAKDSPSGFSTPPEDSTVHDDEPLSPILQLGRLADLDDGVLHAMAPPVTPVLRRGSSKLGGVAASSRSSMSHMTSTPNRLSTPMLSVDQSYWDAVIGFAPNPPDETSPPPTPVEYADASPETSWRSLEAPGEDCRDLSSADWGYFSASIIGAKRVDEGHTVYLIKVSIRDGREFAIMRRFTEFEALRTSLDRVEPPLPPMPPKRLLGNSKGAIGERVAAFNAMLDRCMQLDEQERSPVLAFLSDDGS